MARLIRHLILLVTTGLVGAALVAPPAGAAPTWRPLTNLFADLSAAGSSSFAPAIAADSAGNATVLWSRWNGTQYVVQASYRPVGGTWSAPVDVAGGRRIVDPQVVVDQAGNATAVWRRIDTDRSVVQSASRPLGGTWSTPVDLSFDPSFDPSQQPDVPQLAVDAAGTVTVTWSRFEAPPGQPWRFTAQSATRTTDGTWSTPVDLSPAGSPAKSTDVTVDPAGNATAVWRSAATVQAATRPAGGTWSAPIALTTTASDRAPRVVVDPSGTVTAVWHSFAGGQYGVQTATRPLGGAWTSPVDLARGEVFDTPALAVDRQGTVTALWQRYDAGWIVTSATRKAGGAWSSPVSLSTPARDSWDPQIAVDLAGNATVLWSRADDGGRVVEAANRPAGGEWSEPVDLSAPGDAWNPQVAVDPAGNATAVWARKDGAGYVVQARGLDAAGPVVTEITGETPRTARGTRVYSVKAHDVWSRVASARWTFPDGTTETGASVSYAGSLPGSVRVVLADSVGNATACTYTGTFTCRPTTRIAPVVDRVRLNTKKIRAVGSDARAATKAKATIRLDTDARVTFTFRKAGSKPVRLSKRLDAGRNVVVVRARLRAGKVLEPGRWKVVVTAKNKAGTSAKKKLRLRVVR
ncbi:hypothetical protein GCM10011376_24750 [Nocardioides flavus (ex Wang et al. 2016)]|uniref:Ig-like domain-containing protein n=1 Tax=Nocardioides flavus (ex Wang et al. 2016) TaxID=2058780 RepID=A0ABQ3HPS9_9ACTN|nr:PKD domain-containing protein [Nocardioides flavus (ex Wang et al. 2016)]GHE17865.1 hypothetical protein GCM10011376_24750 [Nocardioides flavus (ex Wang et al. 2016)]